MSQQTKHLYEFGPFRLDPEEHFLLRDGQVVSLAPKVIDTLLALVERSGHVVDKDELMKRVWPDTFVEEVSLAKNVWVLRKALGEEQEEGSYIETIPKRGYRFVAKVKRIAESDGSGSEELFNNVAVTGEQGIQGHKLAASSGLDLDAMATGTGESIEGVISDTSASRKGVINAIKRHQVTATLFVVTLLLAVAGITYTLRVGPAIDSLAILPLSNGSSDPEIDYLSDGITEAITDSLSQLPQLKRVIARSTMANYKGKDIDPRKVGEELNVSAVVTGQLIKRGDDVIITAELVNVADGTRLWGEQYPRKLANIQTVQADLSRDISEELRLRLSGEEKQRLAKHHTENIEAYHLYLRGRYFLNRAGSAGLKTAVEYFLAAIDKDPLYAPAYAGLAEAHNSLGINGVLPQSEAFTKAQAAAKKALELDSRLAEAHVALAHFSMNTWDWVTAEREFKRAIELNPNSERAQSLYAVYLSLMVRPNEAIAVAKRALELDPFSLSVNALAAYVFIRTREYDQAIELSRKTIQMDPKHEIGSAPLVMAYELKGMYEEAIRARTNQERAAALKSAWRAAGAKGYWQEALNHTLLRVKQGQFVRPNHIGILYAQLGEKDRAFEMIQKGFEQRDWDLALLKSDPRLDSLRSDRRYTEMLRQMAFPP